MSIRRHLPFLITCTLLLAGCVGATPTAIIVPTATDVPTVEPIVTQTQAAVATALLPDIVPANDLSDAKHARLRLGLFVLGGPRVDLWVNGQLAVIGGIAQVNLPPDYVNAYLFLPAGIYSVAVVPTGLGISQAIVGPLDLSLAAGHRYTLAVMGQSTDKTPKPLVIDETAAELKVGAVLTDSTRFWINNMTGATEIIAKDGGSKFSTTVTYGDFAVGVYPGGTYPLPVEPFASVYGSASDNWNEPGTSNMVAFNGSWPGAGGTDWDQVDAPATSELNIIDFLQGFTGKHVVQGSEISFETLLAAIKTAGLTDLLITGGPYYMLAPTDSAFAALPKKQLDALLADPPALANLLRNHIVAEYVPRGSLAKTPGGVLDRTLVNLLGAKLTIGDGYTVNGSSVGDFYAYFVANGSYVKVIDTVLLPAAQ